MRRAVVILGLAAVGLGQNLSVEAGDGRANLAQLQAARQAAQAMGGKAAFRGKAQPGPAAFARFDKNGNGVLEPQERVQALQEMQARQANGGLGAKGGPGKGAPGQGLKNGNAPNGKGREEVLKRFDKDGDGKLNEDERAAARKAREQLQNK